MSEIPKGNSETKIEFKTEDGIKLSDTEKESFKKYLDKLKEKDKIEVITLTKEELQEFRNLLKDPRNEQKLQEFIEKQEKETITTAEIMKGSQVVEKLGGIENFKEISDLFNETIYEHFFKNNEGPFKGLTISEDAKRNFSTGANFFFMDYLAQELQKTGTKEEFKEKIGELFGTDKKEGLLENINNLSDLTNKIQENISLFKDLFTGDLGKTLSQVYKPGKETILKKVFAELKIEDYEKEAIFMNPLEAHNFMNFVYNENHSKEEIKNYISARKENGKIEFSQEDKNKLKNIGEKMNTLISPEVGSALGKFSQIKQNFQKIGEGLKNQITKNKGAIEVLSILTAIPILGDFIKSILKFIGITDLDKLLAGKNFEASKKTISENIIGSGSIFEGKKIPNDFMKIKGNNDNSFLNDINFLIGNKKGKDLGKGVLELFKKDGEFQKFGIETKINLLNGENINYTELKKAISLFREYKIAKEKNKVLSVEDFILEKEKAEKAEQIIQEENKKNMGTIKKAEEASKLVVNTKKAKEEAEKKVKKAEEEAEKIKNDKTKTTKEKEEALTKIKKAKEEAKKAEEERLKAEAEQKKLEAEVKKLKEKYTIKENEKLEISGSEAEAIIEVGNKKYKIEIDNQNFTIIGDGNITQYKGGGEIFSYLNQFNGRLNLKAKGGDFGEKDIELNGHTIKDILMNGLNEEVGIAFLSKKVNQKGLKQLFTENFFENGKLKDKVSMTFGKQNYHFEKEKIT